MPSSPSAAVRAPSEAGTARFALWPLPELRLVAPEGTMPAGVPDPPTPEEAAYQRGLEDGRRVMRETHELEVRRTMASLAAVAEALQGSRAEWCATMEANVHALAVAVARRIVQREIATDPALVAAMTRHALEQVELDGRVEVRLHPDDLAEVRARLAPLAPDGRPVDVAWVPDAAVGQGGCIVETPQRLVDGQLDTALRALYERLRDG
jgi:flagellar assembly protein FliH